ncbi:MAG: energy transducer TonB [Bacteroidales bacterium]|nr:energy transducer TonB [Bacteroidales bacterium]
MEPKKTPKADLENKKMVFFQIGLIIALAITYMGFEWKTYDKQDVEEFQRVEVEVEEEMVEITQQDQKLPPPPPPPPQQSIVMLNIVEDDADVDVDIDFSSESDEGMEMEVYTPPVQQNVEEEEVVEEEIFIVVEAQPEYPGGDAARMKFLQENLKYPQMAKESGIQGTVYATFVVEKDGRITDVKILRGIGGGCDEEAIRVIKMMPKWKAGQQRGKGVRVQFNLPIKFTLQG